MAMRQRLQILLVIIAALFASMSALAQSSAIEVKAEVSTQTVFVGEGLSFQISVNGADAATVDEDMQIIGFDTSYAGASPRSFSSTTIINGRRTTEEFHGIDYIWRLVPQREGLLVIPAQDVVVGGRRYSTQPIETRVVPPQEDPDLRFFVDVDNASPYVGQPVRVRITLAWNERAVDSFRTMPEFSFPAVKGPFRVAPLGPEPQQGRQEPLVVLGEPLAYEVIETRIDGDRWRALEVEFALIPTRAGEFDIAPVTASGIIMLRRGRSFFDRPTRRFSVPSGGITLEVEPLPAEGRPESFNGLVGQYSISAQASAGSVNVGDPIELTLRITGPLPSIVEPPALAAQMDLAARFRIGSDEAPPVISGDSKIFRRTIRALSDEVSEIPPIDLPYFNVETGRYEVARSAPLPLEVRPTRVVTTGDAEGALLDAPRAGQPLEELAGGLRHNIGASRALVDQSFTLGAALRSPVGLGTIVAPPILYAGAAVIVLARRRAARDVRHKRRRGALAKAQRAIREAQGAGEAGAAVREFVADRLGRPEGSLTSAQAADLADRFVPSELSGRARDLLERCDQALYAGEAAADVESMREDALSVLREMDGPLRSARG